MLPRCALLFSIIRPDYRMICRTLRLLSESAGLSALIEPWLKINNVLLLYCNALP
jgi:hypothetical protein